MTDLQKLVEEAIVATLNDPYGAGSDLYECESKTSQGWLKVSGNLDIPHLASEIIWTIEKAQKGD